MTGELLVELVERGVLLWVNDGRLRFLAPEGALTEDLRRRAGAVHGDLVDLVAGGAVLPPDLAVWDEDPRYDYEERAGILEYDAGLARDVAEVEAEHMVRVAWTRTFLAGPRADDFPVDPVDHPAAGAVAPFPGREAARTG